MRGLTVRRLRWLAVGAVAALLAVGAIMILGLFGQDTSSEAGAARSSTALPSRKGLDSGAWAERKVTAGEVTVAVTPRRVDGDQAVFTVAFDTHTVELDTPMPRAATLTVGRTPWPAASWEGDGPGGHHREGVLTFTAAGPPDGLVRLVLRGLDRPVTMDWGNTR